MIYCVDLDGTLCETNGMLYHEARPKWDAIRKVNRLYDEGHRIIIDTARGSETGLGWHDFTEWQLQQWGVKYHVLRVGTKVAADRYIDDRAVNARDWLNEAD